MNASKATSPSNSIENTTGSVHIREGAFPHRSVFLDQLRDNKDSPYSNLDGSSRGQLTSGKDRNISLNTFTPPSATSTSKIMLNLTPVVEAAFELPQPNPPTPGLEYYNPDLLDAARPSLDIGPTPPTKDGEFDQQFSQGILTVPSTGYREHSPSPPPGFVQSTTSLSNSSNLGHGNRGISPTVFKAKGLALARNLRKKKSTVTLSKPLASWPPSMSFHDVLAEETSLARARGYAMKLAELLTEDCGLGEWIEMVKAKNRKQPLQLS